ncbi:MAG: hypothetical protein AAF587_24225 [Bacteroidota bacterium]
MATINLSRFTFLNPRTAAIVIWVGFLYSKAINLLYPWFDMYDWTLIQINLFSSFLPSLIYLYAMLVLWKILHEQFRFYKADWGFLLYVLTTILYSILGFGSALQPDLSSWYGHFLFSIFPSAVMIVLILLILRMPQDLFGRKIHLVYTIIGLRILTIVQLLLANMRSEVSMDGTILNFVFMGIGVAFFVFNLLNTIFFYQIFRRAHKNSLVPVPDPSEIMIEEIGEEDL